MWSKFLSFRPDLFYLTSWFKYDTCCSNFRPHKMLPICYCLSLLPYNDCFSARRLQDVQHFFYIDPNYTIWPPFMLEYTMPHGISCCLVPNYTECLILVHYSRAKATISVILVCACSFVTFPVKHWPYS